MKKLAAGGLILAVFLLANVVAGGVLIVLWPLVRGWDELAPLGVFLIGLLAVACALLFALGALHHLPRLFR